MFSCFYLGIMPNDHIYTPAATTTTIISVCPNCGIITKSGEMSCCGHSGSWFENCGSAGNANVDHTWYEGIQACKTIAQSKAAMGRQSNAAQQLNSSNGFGMVYSKAAIMTAKMPTFTSASMSTPTTGRTSTKSLRRSTRQPPHLQSVIL